MNSSFLLNSTLIFLLGLLWIPATGCNTEKNSASATDTASDTESDTESESESESETEPEQGMPDQGFWGYLKTYDDSTGVTDPVSREVCAATAEQLADPENPPDPKDMICVTSSADGSYALALEDGSYGLCTVICDYDCIVDFSGGLVVERHWEAGPGGGVFEPNVCGG